jgi:hypothetical protein
MADCVGGTRAKEEKAWMWSRRGCGGAVGVRLRGHPTVMHQASLPVHPSLSLSASQWCVVDDPVSLLLATPEPMHAPVNRSFSSHALPLMARCRKAQRNGPYVSARFPLQCDPFVSFFSELFLRLRSMTSSTTSLTNTRSFTDVDSQFLFRPADHA